MPLSVDMRLLTKPLAKNRMSNSLTSNWKVKPIPKKHDPIKSN